MHAMLVTPESNRRNQLHALAFAALLAAALGLLAWMQPSLLPALLLVPPAYWLLRRRIWRRLRVMNRDFPPEWEAILRSRVAFYQALNEEEKQRFRQMVLVFLDEVRITGIRTDVDDTCRVLVAASAAIPVFGFHDWEYRRLGEVLIYPDSFGEKYETTGAAERNILGMVGTGHLRGVMILSKPDLLNGFANPRDRQNVGIHEFAHLVEEGEAEDGLPPEVPREVVRQWVAYVGRELTHPSPGRKDINRYAYTNEHEFFAVLAEYFFESPETLRQKDPQLYQMLREMFHQDTASLFRLAPPRRLKYGRNSPCPCGSGKKYKNCCLVTTRSARSKTAA
jgi:Mlc titration factor MtfA (ptsG expression regulator)